MITSLVRNWWAVGVVGVLGIVVGLMAFYMPISTLASLVMVFGAYALVTGVFQVVAGATGETMGIRSSRGWIIASGVLGIIAGLVTLTWPGLSAVALYTLVAVWAIMAGITQAIAAVVHRNLLEHTWLVALGGVAMAIFGAYLLATPAGVLALAFALGVYAMTYGILMIAAAVQLKRVHDRVEIVKLETGRPTAVRDEELTRR